jgi:hypothetical protein
VPTRVRAAFAWCAVFVVVFFATYTLYLGRPVNRTDETWMLWLLHRIAHGDVLYRDAYDVTTPLSAWIGAVLVWIAGPQLVVLRGMVAASFSLQLVLGLAIVRRCGLRTSGSIVFAVGLIAFGSPLVAYVSAYSSVASLGAVVALFAVLVWYERRDDHRRAAISLAAAGAACGFAFWSKPNVGFLVTSAVAVFVVAVGVRERRRVAADLGWATAGGIGVTIPVVVFLAASGAWSAFIDQVFLSKRQYVDVGFSYVTAFQDRVQRVFSGTHTDLRSIVQLTIMATPVIVIAVLVWACWRNHRNPDLRYVSLVAFACAGLASVFPRPGVNHFTDVMPLTFTATVGLWALTPRRHTVTSRARLTVFAAAALIAFVGASVVAGDSVQAYSNPLASRDFPHFEAVPIRRHLATRMDRLRNGIWSNTDGRVFIAREDAGFLYFETGTRNPLPYDMVERSDFGGGGEHTVIKALIRSRVRYVCLHPPRPPRKAASPLVPATLEHWVRTHYAYVGRYPACDLYRAAAGSDTGPRA